MKKVILSGAFLLGSTLLFSACSSVSTADNKEAGQVSNQQQVYIDSQPVPAFDWSLERHMLIELYKARNNAVVTYSYVRNLQGQVVFQCKSIGFPIPANTQLTNPEKIADPYSQRGFAILPQADPNGLYTSNSTVGTYVFCLNDDGSVSPSYFESDVEAHTAALQDGNMTVSQNSTLKIQTKK